MELRMAPGRDLGKVAPDGDQGRMQADQLKL